MDEDLTIGSGKAGRQVEPRVTLPARNHVPHLVPPGAPGDSTLPTLKREDRLNTYAHAPLCKLYP